MSAIPRNAEIGKIKVAGPVQFRVSTTNRFQAFILSYSMNAVEHHEPTPDGQQCSDTALLVELLEPSLNSLMMIVHGIKICDL